MLQSRRVVRIKTKLHAQSSHATSGNTSEFGATLGVLICLILIPLLSAAFIPIRYSMCQGSVTELVARLARSEKRSDAYTTLNTDGRWKKLLSACGAEVKDAKLVLVATSSKGGNQQIVVQQGNSIPQDWLPDGANSPCTYSLHLDVVCAVAPLFGGTGAITGINAPVNLTVSSSAHWENLSRDPKSPTLAFCIDE